VVEYSSQKISEGSRGRSNNSDSASTDEILEFQGCKVNIGPNEGMSVP
jgi:hypothetical protein